MQVSSLFPVAWRRPLPLVLAAGLLVGGSIGSGCTPSSSGPPSSPDTTSTSAERTTALSEESTAPRPTRSPAPSDSARTVAQRLADASVEARIKQALVRERSLRVFDFFPEVVRGRVVLRGDVHTREQHRQAERIVESLEGVETVANQITVEGHPVSAADDGSAPVPSSDAEYYTVQRGDTLWDIAREYDVPIPQIKALNPYSASPPRPGERLRVR